MRYPCPMCSKPPEENTTGRNRVVLKGRP